MKDKWWDPAMVRNELLLDMDAKTGPVAWKFIGRYDREVQTDYLAQLHHLTTAIGSEFNHYGTSISGGTNYMDQYNTTSFLQSAREFYSTFTLGDRYNFRIGKQQIVWGESDFFHAMDIISGFDYTNRLFFENNEEYRKPLMMAKINIDMPELDGNLDLFVRPGLDPGNSIGSTYALNGGRWAVTPYQGVDFTAYNQYNYHADGANKNDPTFGLRWKGDWHEIGYSLAYIKTFNPDPMVAPASTTGTGQYLTTFGVNQTTPWRGKYSTQALGDFIYPEIEAYGGSANYYFESLDSVFNVESVYVPNKPYNYGALNSSLPGWAGIKGKDTMVDMLRVDHQVHTQDWLGTNRPSLSSVQVFDTWILDYTSKDQIVQFFSMGKQEQEHQTYITYFILLNYFGDTINPSFVAGIDASNGGGFLIPAVDFVFGDSWRLKLEADVFFDNNYKSQYAYNNTSGLKANPLGAGPIGTTEYQSGLFGYFHGDTQFVARITRQF